MKHSKKSETPWTPIKLNCCRRRWHTNFKTSNYSKSSFHERVLSRKEKQYYTQIFFASVSQTAFTRKSWESDIGGNRKVIAKISYRKGIPYCHTSDFVNILFLDNILKGENNLVDCLKDILFEEKQKISSENFEKITTKEEAKTTKTETVITHPRRKTNSLSNPQILEKSLDKLYRTKEKPACPVTQGPEQTSTLNDTPLNQYKTKTVPRENEKFCSHKTEIKCHHPRYNGTSDQAEKMKTSDEPNRTEIISVKCQNPHKISYYPRRPVSTSAKVKKTKICIDQAIDASHLKNINDESLANKSEGNNFPALKVKKSANNIPTSVNDGSRKGNESSKQIFKSKNKEKTEYVIIFSRRKKKKDLAKETNDYAEISNLLKIIFFDSVFDSHNDKHLNIKKKNQNHNLEMNIDAKKISFKISEAKLKKYSVKNKISKHKHGFIFPEVTSSVMRAKKVDDDDDWIDCLVPRTCPVKNKKKEKKEKTCTEPKKKEKKKKKKKLPPCQEEIVVCKREKPPCQKDDEEDDKLCEIPECKRELLERLFEDCFEKTEGQCGLKACCSMPSCKKAQMRKLLMPCDSDSSVGSVTNATTSKSNEIQSKSNNTDDEQPCGCDQIKSLQSQMDMLQKFVQSKLEESISHIKKASKEKKPTPCKYLGTSLNAGSTQTSEFAINDPTKCPPSCATVPETQSNLECVEGCPAKPKVKKSYCQLKREEEKTSQTIKSFCAQKRGGSAKLPCDANCHCSKEPQGHCEDDCPSRPKKTATTSKVTQTEQKRRNVTTFTMDTPATSRTQKHTNTESADTLQLRKKESPTYVQNHTNYFGSDLGSKGSSFTRNPQHGNSSGVSPMPSLTQYDSGHSSRTSSEYSTIDKVQNILGNQYGR